MARYEREAENGLDFWEIARDGVKVTTRWGKGGKKGRSHTRRFAVQWQAQRHAREQIAEKSRQGYRRVGRPGPRPEPHGAREPKLEALIAERPGDAGPYLIYADWLQQRGDPRGELIALQHALELHPRDRRLQQRVAALRAVYDDQFRALVEQFELSAPGDREPRLELTWRWGFVGRARVAHDWFYDEPEVDADLEAFIAALLALPSMRLLQDLTLGLLRLSDGLADYAGAVKSLAAAPRPTLRRLFIGDFEYPDAIEISWTDLGDLSGVWRAAPRLHQLILQGGAMKLGEIVLPELRRFEVRTGGLSRESAASIAGADWPALEHLSIWFGRGYYGAEADLETIGPILAGEALPRLTHLGLANAEFADGICRALAGAPIVGQLETLDLSKGTMTDAGAEALAAAHGRLAHLERIDVSDNYLTDEGRRSLRVFGRALVFGEQRVADFDEGEVLRYASVGE